MYRIRSASGGEAVYNSLEEFHAAVRRGEVAAEDEIFHTRANRWLDVKSHPHYRSAMGWNGSGEHSLPPAPPAPAHTPAAAPRVAAAIPGPHAPEAHARVVEAVRPSAPPQTVLRPQLVADRPPIKTAAPAPAPLPAAAPAQTVTPVAPAGPPRRSRELAFIDLGQPAPSKTQNATIIEAQKPAPVAPKPAPKPNPVPPQGTELQFLVMDDGIESPVRNSSGHRTVPEDLDLLFGAPSPGAPATSPVSVAPAPAATPQPKPVTVARAAPTAPVAEPPALPPQKATAAPAEPPRPASPKPEPVKPASLPAAPVVEAKAAPPVEPPAPRHTSAPQLAAGPATLSRPAPVAQAVDLDIPGPALFAQPEVAVSAPVAVPAAHGARRGLMFGAGAFVLLVGVAVAAWRPWVDRPAAPISAALTPDPTSGPAGAGIPPALGLTGAVSGSPASRPGGANPPASTKSTEAGVAPRIDSAVDAADDEVIAASRPNFRPDVDVGAASLSLGTDLPVAGPSAAIPPSELAARLVRAEQQAQQDLVARLGGFRALLEPGKIGKADGAARSLATWSAGADAMRQYRARIARLEQAYQDSVLTSQRAQRWPADELRAWTVRQTVAEPGEVAQLVDLMISQVSEGLDLLAASDGQYTIKGDRIVFNNSGAVARYLSIRGWVDQRISSWQSTPESARPYTLNALLRALGDGFPAVQ